MWISKSKWDLNYTALTDCRRAVISLSEEIGGLHREVIDLRKVMTLDRTETLAWTKALMDRYVELSMVRGGDNTGASQHRRVVGTYPEAGQPETDPEPEENDDTDWAPAGSDIGTWR